MRDQREKEREKDKKVTGKIRINTYGDEGKRKRTGEGGRGETVEMSPRE